MDNRKELKLRAGQRFRCRATVDRFGTKRGWNGHVPTVLLKNVRDARTGALLTDHLWFATGRWSANLRFGDEFEFDARVSDYVKGYQGRREVPEAPVTRDWRLERPTKVEVIRANKTGLVRRPAQERRSADASTLPDLRVRADAADEQLGTS